MKLTAQVKLLPDETQADALKKTLEVANNAANYVSDYAWVTGTFRQYDLHKALYYEIRKRFELSAQMTVRLLAKVADAYKLDRKTRRTFQPHSAIAYDDRILKWYPATGIVSIWTVKGRIATPYACGNRQRAMLQSQQGETDLAYVNGKFFLLATCNIEEELMIEPGGVLGIDLGIINIASDSDGDAFSGSTLNGMRARHRKLRAKLQSKGTRASRRLLKKRKRKETRFATHTNHCISKKIVAKAKDTNRAIALEELKGIRSRTTVRKPQRATHNSWAFFQLRSFIDYKAKRVGVPVFFVDPRNTSRTCPSCGCIDKHNRPSQALFSCISCGLAGPADTIAARIIAGRAAVDQPYFSPASSG